MAQAVIAHFQRGFGDVEFPGTQQLRGAFHAKLAQILGYGPTSGGGESATQMKGTATDGAADFFERGGRRQIFREHGDDFFDALGGKTFGPVAKEFVIVLGDKEKFGGGFQGFGLIPNLLREGEYGRLAKAGEQLLLAAGQARDGGNSGIARAARDDFADEGMQRGDVLGEMLGQKVKRHLDGEKLVALAGLTGGPQGLGALAVKTDGHGREGGFGLPRSDFAIPLDIQANLDGAGVKALAPIKRCVGLEIVPFEAHAGAQDAAMEGPPAGAELAPSCALGKGRLIVGIVGNGGHDGTIVA